jgi:hypothetical protein
MCAADKDFFEENKRIKTQRLLHVDGVEWQWLLGLLELCN